LHRVMPEYERRVRVRPFPLEVAGSGPAPPRDILEQEWWLAAIQEPAADFAPYERDDWPATTLPASSPCRKAHQAASKAGSDYDLRVRRAFFAEGRNIGRREVLLEIAEEAGLDARHFERAIKSGEASEAVLEECRSGKERYRVRSTPKVMLPDGTKLNHPIAFPTIKERKVVGIKPLPCCGEGCLDATRNLFEEALRRGSGVASG
jgi:predicted DsbA family dithiol-disulfide isomerase